MELDKIKKKAPKKLNQSLKHKAERSSKLEGVLASKVQQSIEKARFVQQARRLGWDQINRNISVSNDLVEKPQDVKPMTDAEIEQMEEDAYVKEFFKKGEAEEKEEEEEKESPAPGKGNIFSVLEETEC